jgi:4-amino-4-deoxy-L-arabinose transferase-like glycosyltransferase
MDVSRDRLVRLGPSLVAAATFLLHALAWDRYGVFRDELYFIACGQRLAFGYVDQPPGIAAVAGLAHAMFGAWVPGLRLFSWIAAAGIVYLTGRLAVRLGGGSFAAVLASLAALASPLLRGLGHLLTMNVFEGVLLLGTVHVLVTLVQGAAARRWLAAALLAAGAVLMKYSAAMLSVALVAGLLTTPERRALRTRWALGAAALAAVLVLPNLAWQAAHGFPFLELVRNGQLHKNAPFSLVDFLGSLVIDGGPVNAALWAGGLGWLLVAPAARPYRFVGVGAALYLALLLATQGKAYYFGTALPPLLAAGAVALERSLPGPAGRVALGCAVGVQLALAPLALPLLPEATFVRYQAALGVKRGQLERDRPGALPQLFADMHGWQALADAAGRAAAGLPEAERRTAVVYGSNYGLAAAVDVLGEGRLPPAVSGHNQYFLWGVPAGRGDPAIVIGHEDEDCGGVFRERVRVERLPSDPWVRPFEDARTIWICRGASPGALEALWPRLRHYE